MDQNGTISRVKEMIEESARIVVMLGVGTEIESGGENIWSSRECYRLEDIYHKSPDEMMSVGYYSARRDKFFEFYKAEMLGKTLKPASLFKDLKRLEKKGRIHKVITQCIMGIHRSVGLKNVVELHGDIAFNHCTHCGKEFSPEYIKAAKGVPLCDECKTPIRPGILLFGETIGNDLMTEAVNACEEADMILVLGTNMNDNMVKYTTGNYKGDRLVLITKEEHYTDRYADFVIHGKVSDMLPLVIS